MSTAFQIPLSYVINVTAVQPSQGLEPKQMGTILILTDETPANAISGAYMIARTATAVATQWGTETEVAKQAQMIFAQSPNILVGGGYVIVANYLEEETLAEAITRLSGEIYFEGVLTTRDLAQEEAVAASTLVESMKDRILMLPGYSTADLTGLFAQVTNNVYTRPVLYLTGADTETKKLNSRLFAAAYLSRGLAVNYNGSKTTMTMNLKDLAGLVADTAISETILNQCTQAGVDCFPSIEGLAKVISNKHAGQYFDQVANSIWFVGALEIAYFNVLATSRAKIAQTDDDLGKAQKAIRKVCNQAVANGYLAPGTWNSTDTFGNIDDFNRNIEEFGFYLYQQPVAEQSQTDRANRIAPLLQIAGKEAGAVHTGAILVYIEA
jgi:hypothetical protein